jgi:two-component system cell cycle sensor histidine kinase/response regulator CckA
MSQRIRSGYDLTFRICLPLINTGKVREIKSAGAPSLEKGKETILLAEDNIEVRNSAKEILSASGYKVIEAVDGEDAISVFMNDGHMNEIDLLILDVIMPKKNGRQVYEAIKTAKSDIKVLFASGYSADIIHKKGVIEGDLDFILKPFSSRDFLTKVREILDR